MLRCKDGVHIKVDTFSDLMIRVILVDRIDQGAMTGCVVIFSACTLKYEQQRGS